MPGRAVSTTPNAIEISPGQVHDSVDQQALIHGFDGPDLGGLVVDDDERAVSRSEQMVCERVADGLAGHEMPPRR